MGKPTQNTTTVYIAANTFGRVIYIPRGSAVYVHFYTAPSAVSIRLLLFRETLAFRLHSRGGRRSSTKREARVQHARGGRDSKRSFAAFESGMIGAR